MIDREITHGAEREQYVKGKARKLVSEHFYSAREKRYPEKHIAGYFGREAGEIPSDQMEKIVERLILLSAHYVETYRRAKKCSYAEAMHILDFENVFVHDAIHTAVAFESNRGDKGASFVHDETKYTEESMREEVHALLFTITWTKVLMMDTYPELLKYLYDHIYITEALEHHLTRVATESNFRTAQGRSIILATAIVLELARTKSNPEAYAKKYLPKVQESPNALYTNRVSRVYSGLKEGNRLVLVQEFLAMSENVPEI